MTSTNTNVVHFSSGQLGDSVDVSSLDESSFENDNSGSDLKAQVNASKVNLMKERNISSHDRQLNFCFLQNLKFNY